MPVNESIDDELKTNHQIDENPSDIDDNDILELLEESDVFEKYRASRIQQISDELKQAEKNIAEGHGSLLKVNNDKELLDLTVRHGRCVVHFSHPEFQRCKIMSKALEQLARQHTETLFVEINAADAPFLVAKLSIKVLPLVIGFVKGLEKCRLVGFEALGGTDSFSLTTLQTYLTNAGITQRGTRHNIEKFRTRIKCTDTALDNDCDDLDI